MLTVFSAPKSFADPHIRLIQTNAIRSWLALGPEVEVLLVGDEPGLADTAEALKVGRIPDVERNQHGTPRLDSIFRLACQGSSQPLLAYVNADILLLPDLVQAADTVRAEYPEFLMVGQRWDLSVSDPLVFGEEGQQALRLRVKREGSLHPAGGSDYFVFPRGCFTDIPPFAIGRSGWDNWMIYSARRNRWPVVDATQSVMVVHQEHDYAHLPGGQMHYRLPETAENVRLAGGRRRIFDLADADHLLKGGKSVPRPATLGKILRDVERAPVLRTHSSLLSHLAFGLFHPERAWREVRGILGYWLVKASGKEPRPAGRN
jgi:hypothetical protein